MATTQSYSSKRKLSPEWQSRIKNLPRLHLRAQSLYQLVFGAIHLDNEGSPILPANIATWFKQIYSESDENGFTDALDLLNSPLPAHLSQSWYIDSTQDYTKHKHIQLTEYEPHFQTFSTQLSYRAHKPAQILYLTNLSLLLANLIFLSGDWDATSPEERALALANIDLVFPGKFTSDSEVSDVYVIHELRTQIFVQHFLEAGGLDDWDTSIQLGEIFKLDDMRSVASGVPNPPMSSRVDGSFGLRIRMQLGLGCSRFVLVEGGLG